MKPVQIQLWFYRAVWNSCCVFAKWCYIKRYANCVLVRVLLLTIFTTTLNDDRSKSIASFALFHLPIFPCNRHLNLTIHFIIYTTSEIKIDLWLISNNGFSFIEIVHIPSIYYRFDIFNYTNYICCGLERLQQPTKRFVWIMSCSSIHFR